ncbi:MAG: hypothetical protein ABIZ09_06590 [Rhodoferax sp.]
MTSIKTPSIANTGTKEKSMGFLDRLHRKILILWMLLVCASLLCLLTFATIWYIWNDLQGDKLRSTEPAGRVLAVAQSTGLFTRALVETDLGFYSLTDGASLAKAENLSLQTRGNGARFLCDSHQRCMRLNESLDWHRPKPGTVTEPEQLPQPAGARP